jgi:hypothetical protein
MVVELMVGRKKEWEDTKGAKDSKEAKDSEGAREGTGEG